MQRGRFEPRLALRNTIGVVVPLVAGLAFNHVGTGLIAASGALNVAFRDSHAPYPERARHLVAASLIAGLAVTVGALSGSQRWAAVPIAGGWAFGAALLVALGERAANLGMMSVVLLVIYAAVPLSPGEAWLAGLTAAAGGGLQTLLAVALWPLGRHSPERRALAALYRELGRTSAALSFGGYAATTAPPASREAIDAQNALGHDRSNESQRFWFLFTQAERARMALLALARLTVRLERESPAADAPPVAHPIRDGLTLLAPLFTTVADALESPRPRAPPPPELEQLAAFSRQWPRMPAADRAATWPVLTHDAHAQLDALAGQLRAALEVARQGTAAASPRAPPSASPSLGEAASTLRASLTLRSTACRHAVRMGLCVAAADAIGIGLGFSRPYWIPMTVALVLKPDFGATFNRGALRLAGTYVGLLLATVLFHALPASAAARITVVAAFVYLARWTGGANYGFLALSVAALAVYLLSLDHLAPHALIAARAIDTTIGGALALAVYALWPTWERGNVATPLARTLERFAAYLRALVTLQEPETLRELEPKRAAGRLARTNLEASIQRALSEPGTSPELATRLSAILASCRRLAHALLALEAALRISPVVPAPLRQLVADIEATLLALAALLRGTRRTMQDWPDLREDHGALVRSTPPTASQSLPIVEADRIVNAVNTIRVEILALTASQ